jgi:hypothetical protein
MSIKERPIEIILEELKGRAKQLYLAKWRKWILEMARTYEVEDIKALLGWDITEDEQLGRFLLEIGHGLTESEIFQKVESLMRQASQKKIKEKQLKGIMDYLQHIRYREAIDPFAKFQLPSHIEAELKEIKRKPELDGARAFDLVFKYLTSLTIPEEDARKIAEEVKSLVVKVPKEKRPEILEGTLSRAQFIKQKTLKEFAVKEEKAKQIVKQATEEIKKVREEKIMSLEDLSKLGVNLLPATRTKTVEEAEEAVVNWIIAHRYEFAKRAIEFPIKKASNVFVVFFPDKKPNFKTIERNGVLVVLEADKESLIYVKTDNFVYFNTFKPLEL